MQLLNLSTRSGGGDEKLCSRYAEDIKKSLCKVALDYPAELEHLTEDARQEYKLPDGQVINMGDEILRAPEVLFDGAGEESLGIHQAIIDVINKKIDSAERVPLYGNIIITGGSSLLTGMQERLSKEVRELAPTKIHRKDVTVRVIRVLLFTTSARKK